MATLNIKGFPDGLYRKLKQRAKRHRRSVAQEVTQMLGELVDAPKLLTGNDLTERQTPARVGPQPASWE